MKTGGLLVLVAMLAAGSARADPTWPTDDADWNPIMVGTSYYIDPKDPPPESVDLVGNATNPTGYYYEDWTGMSLQFRMRLSDGVSQDNWMVLFDVDGDNTTVEYALELSKSGSNDRVALVAVTGTGTTWGTVTLSTTDWWVGAESTWSQWTATGSNLFGSKDDYFLDLAVPVGIFSQVTGWSPGDSFRVALATSTTHSAVNKDQPLNLGPDDDIADGLSNSITSHLPEPGTLVLVALGLGAVGGSRLRRRKRRAGS